LESAYRQTGVVQPELERAKDIPQEVQYVWNWFKELHNTRSSNGFSANALTYQEILAWATLTGRNPDAWEVQLIKYLDMQFLLSRIDNNKGI